MQRKRKDAEKILREKVEILVVHACKLGCSDF
jgi:hypothetical protein